MRRKRRIHDPESLRRDWLPADVHDYRIDREQFIVYVGTDPGYYYTTDDTAEVGVESRMADRFQANMMTLSGIDSKRPALVIMSTCGGLWEPGMQMFSTILYCPNPVTVLATKWARSMTSLIPLAADKFIIRPPAQYMYHRGTFAFEGLDQEMDTDDRERRKSRELMYRIYVSRLKEKGKFSSWSSKRIRHMLEYHTRHEIDKWLSPREAVEWGFADEVEDSTYSIQRAETRNARRRSRMKHVLSRPISVTVTVS